MTKAEPVVKITGIDEHGPLLGWYRHWADFPIGTEFYAASPAGAEVVRVKPLVWGMWPADGSTSSVAGHPRRYRRLRALTEIGAYFINEGEGIGGEPHFYVDLRGDQIWDGDTNAEAKAAAQADYERRILSALEPTPSTDAVRRQAREEALEEAARVAERHGVYPELNVWGGGPEWYRHGQDIAKAIRALTTPPAGAAALNEGEE